MWKLIVMIARAPGDISPAILIYAAALAALLIAPPAHSATPDFCLNKYIVQYNMEVTKSVTFTGKTMVEGDWKVPYDTIVVNFEGDAAKVWNPYTVAVERKVALMDWIESALNYQMKNGFHPFAARNYEGEVWLVGQYVNDKGETQCPYHRLDGVDSLT